MNMKENGLDKNKKLKGDQLGKVFGGDGGGVGNWTKYAQGSYIYYQTYIVYTMWLVTRIRVLQCVLA